VTSLITKEKQIKLLQVALRLKFFTKCSPSVWRLRELGWQKKVLGRDGAGVHRVVTGRCNGAKTVQDADAAERAVQTARMVEENKLAWRRP